MSIVVLTDRTAKEVKTLMVSGGCSNENLTVQTVKRTQYDPDGTEYPVNLMRNLAMSASSVNSKFIILGKLIKRYHRI